MTWDDHVGFSLGHVRPCLGHFGNVGPFLGHVGSVLGYLGNVGPFLSHFRPCFGLYFAILGHIWQFWAIFPHLAILTTW